MASQAPAPRASARMDEGSDVGDLMVSDYYMGQLLIAISGFWLLLLLLAAPHLPQYLRYRRYGTYGTYGAGVRRRPRWRSVPPAGPTGLSSWLIRRVMGLIWVLVFYIFLIYLFITSHLSLLARLDGHSKAVSVGDDEDWS